MYKLQKRLISGILAASFAFIPGGSKALTDSNKKIKRQVYAYDRYTYEQKYLGVIEFDSYEKQELSDVPCCYLDREAIDELCTVHSDVVYQKFFANAIARENSKIMVNPDINSPFIEIVSQDTVLEVLAINSNMWVLVNYKNKLGFIPLEKIKIVNQGDIERQVSNLPKIIDLNGVSREVQVRNKPNKESKKIGTLSQNDSFNIIKRLDNGWVAIEKNGKKGYILGKYIIHKFGINGKPFNVAYLNKETDIYNYPFETAINTLEQYQSVNIYGEVDGYYYIECDGEVGFIEKNKCSVLNGNFIIVDISSQRMVYYKDSQEEISSPIVSGKEESPTNLGIYSIYFKKRNRYLVGEDYRTLVNYWMAFNDSQGLHDAYWRKRFGREIYKKDGSHGCVNLPLKVARELYGNAKIGTKVLVKK